MPKVPEAPNPSSARRTRGAVVRGVVLAVVLVVAALAAVLALWSSSPGGEADGEADGAGTDAPSAARHAASIRLPPAHAGFDYQIGEPYPPPSGAGVIIRDHSSSPAAGHYGVCYVNAFQAQPGRDGDWPPDLLLRDAHGRAVVDEDWHETLLDIGTPAKRARVAQRVGALIDACARRGYDAVEPDNYDSYQRSHSLLTSADAKAYITLLSRHAHALHLAVAQKNTVELAPDRAAAGLDFAVVEECGRYDECGDYAAAFDDHVLDVEYEPAGLRAACRGHGDRIGVVLRDLDVVAPGTDGYLRRTCP